MVLQKLEFTESNCSSSSEALSEKELSAEELNKQLEKLIVEDKANDEQIFDWVEVQRDFHPPCRLLNCFCEYVLVWTSRGLGHCKDLVCAINTSKELKSEI